MLDSELHVGTRRTASDCFKNDGVGSYGNYKFNESGCHFAQ